MGTDLYLKTIQGELSSYCNTLWKFESLQNNCNKHNFDRDIASNTTGTTLHYSARNGIYELVTFFADKRTDIHLKNDLGQNCLYIAAAYEHLNLCKTIIDKQSFDVHMADNKG